MAIEFDKHGNQILLIYTTDDYSWIDHNLEENGKVRIRKTFYFNRESLIDNSEENRKFLFAILENGYYKIAKEILDIEYDIFISEELRLNHKMFIAETSISIFNKLSNIVKKEIYIGGDKQNIPIDTFNQLIREFPTTTEIKHYANHRIERVINNHLDIDKDYYDALQRNINSRAKAVEHRDFKFIKQVIELEKFEFAYQKLEELLENSDSIPEKEWQEHIVNIILLIFPKYIKYFCEVCIKDFYSDRNRESYKKMDVMLVDFNGNIDAIEIKKPFKNKILHKTKYRKNYIPHKELSGSIMQVEKYIFHLTKWGRQGEVVLSSRYKGSLPNNLHIKITNPRAFIIMGRDDDFSDEQKLDFEVIRRQHNNIIDILTYDDLLRRVRNIIDMLKIA